MARAIVGGLVAQGTPPSSVQVVDPHGPTRDALVRDFGVGVQASMTSLTPEALRALDGVIWAVKPQGFAEAAAPAKPGASAAGALQHALHVSVMAGVRSDAIVQATGSARVVRAMPNTPALIGEGVAGLYARPAVSAAERAQVAALLKATGAVVWLDEESMLDAVTALSGSGPAYVFYVLEAMMAAGERMGLPAAVAKQLALQTLRGATALAAQSSESLATLRERVTSKGGTTHAALTVMNERGVGPAIEAAIEAARDRARALGDAF